MVVFLVFWGFLVWFLIDKSNLEFWIININYHAITLAIIWIDYLLNYNISEKKKHIIYFNLYFYLYYCKYLLLLNYWRISISYNELEKL